MAVKIIIRRSVPRTKEAELKPLLMKMRTLAVAQPGYISGETMRNVNRPDDYMVISTWDSMDNWQAWFSSGQRAEIQNEIDALLGSKTEYDAYYYG